MYLPDFVVAELKHLELSEGVEVLNLGDLVGDEVEPLQVHQLLQTFNLPKQQFVSSKVLYICTYICIIVSLFVAILYILSQFGKKYAYFLPKGRRICIFPHFFIPFQSFFSPTCYLAKFLAFLIIFRYAYK